MDPNPMGTGRVSAGEWGALAALVAVAVALRVAFVFALRAHPAFDAPTMDAGYHWAWARALAEGREFQDGPFFRAPLYPVWLSLWVALFGDASTLAPRLAQAALGGVSVALTWALGRRVGRHAGGARSATAVGLGAAALVALMWSLIAFDAELLIPTLYVPLLLAGVLLTARALEQPLPRRALLAGLVLGLSAITRPNVLLWLPLPMLMLLRRSGARVAATLALGACLAILPVTVRNALEGDPTLIATQGGVNLWIGNNPSSDGSTAIVPGTRGGWWEGFHDTRAAAAAATGRALRATEVSGYYFRRTWDFVRERPAFALQLLLWKARLFLSARELGNNTDERFIAERFAPWLGSLPVRFGWLAAFGAVGLLLAALRGSSGRLVGGFVALYAASVVLFFVNTRFRLPVVPGLAIGAVYFVERLRVVLTGRGPKWELLAAPIALGVLAFAYLPLPGVRDGRATGLMDLAKAELARGDARAARALLEEALTLEPNQVFARVAFASVLQQTGEPERAVRLMEETQRLPGGDRPEVTAQLVDALVDAGRPADGQRIAESALARDPRQPSLHYGLARALGMLGDAPSARAALLRVLEQDPSAAHAAFSLGDLEAALGDKVAARAAFGRVLALEGQVSAALVEAARQRLTALE
ncbi:MAG: tetratricopeptide repeat protein [Planctomycetota bacterium]